jgi:hypothetical protein
MTVTVNPGSKYGPNLDSNRASVTRGTCLRQDKRITSVQPEGMMTWVRTHGKPEQEAIFALRSRWQVVWAQESPMSRTVLIAPEESDVAYGINRDEPISCT